MTIADIRERVAKWGEATGTRLYRKHLAKESLTRGQAIKAKCADCTAGFADGRFDCCCPSCPLHPFMPYKGRLPK